MVEQFEQDDREALIERLHDVAGQLGESSLKAGGNEGLRNAANEITVVANALARRSPEPQQVSTVEELDALPVGSVVHSAGGVIACRYDVALGVVFGDERAFPWVILALPATVLWVPDTEGGHRG